MCWWVTVPADNRFNPAFHLSFGDIRVAVDSQPTSIVLKVRLKMSKTSILPRYLSFCNHVSHSTINLASDNKSHVTPGKGGQGVLAVAEVYITWACREESSSTEWTPYRSPDFCNHLACMFSRKEWGRVYWGLAAEGWRGAFVEPFIDGSTVFVCRIVCGT